MSIGGTLSWAEDHCCPPALFRLIKKVLELSVAFGIRGVRCVALHAARAIGFGFTLECGDGMCSFCVGKEQTSHYESAYAACFPCVEAAIAIV